MSFAELIRSMSAAGAPAEAIALAVEAIEGAEAKLAAIREAARDRKRAQRSKDSHGTVTGQSRDSHAKAPLPRPPSPQTPLPPTPTPPDITTRERRLPFAKSDGFSRFWDAYPHKVAKGRAEPAYAKALAKIGGLDPPAVLLAGVERAKSSKAWIDGYIPHPATWLNGGCWEDQPAEAPLNLGQRHERPHPDKRATAYAERLGDIGAAMEAALQQRGGSG